MGHVVDERERDLSESATHTLTRAAYSYPNSNICRAPSSQTYSTVIHDGGVFKLFYNSECSCTPHNPSCPSSDYPGAPGYPNSTDRPCGGLFYAESADGLRFDRPALGEVPWPTMNSSRANNIAFDAGGGNSAGVLLDLHDAPARRYKAFGSFASFNNRSVNGSIIGMVTSADGKRWEGHVDVTRQMKTIPYGDTANQLMWDEELQLYLAFSRFWCHSWMHCGTYVYGMRREYRSTAPFYEGPWSIAVEVARGEPGYEMYSLVPWRNGAWAAGTYFAIGSYYNTTDPPGKVYCELLVSTDHGGNWTRLAPHAQFIPLGAPGDYDDHTCYAAPPIVDPGNASRTLLYYAGGNGPHSGLRSDFIALATVPTHAFVGLRAAASESAPVLETAAVAMAGARLFLTAAGGSSAVVDIELVDGASGASLASGRLDSPFASEEPVRRELVLYSSRGEPTDGATGPGGGGQRLAADLRWAVGRQVWLRVRASDVTLFAAEFAAE